MECCLPVLVVAVLLGISALSYGHIPESVAVVFKELVNTISDKGAFTGGCVAGSLSAISLILMAENFSVLDSQCIFLALIAAAGALSGTAAGALWAVLKRRGLQMGARNGAVGGTITAILTIPVAILGGMVVFAM